jgi:hypothetical protein
LRIPPSVADDGVVGKWIRLSLAASAAVAGLIAAAPASASQTIGQAYSSSGGAGSCANTTFIQTQYPGGLYEAPFDGVITSWASRGFWGAATFKVARLAPGNKFSVIGSDGPRAFTAGFDELQSYPVRMSVRQGDVIGAYQSTADWCPYAGPTGTAVGRATGDQAIGTTATFDTTGDTQVPIQAQIERDADNDGYGDETQDLCPTNGMTHGPCPLPTVLGQTFKPSPLSGSWPEGFTRVVTNSPGVVSAAPADGVITSWSFDATADVDGSIKLKMFRPQGGDTYTAIGESAKQTPVANVLNTFATRIPVRAGDRVGAWSDNVGVVSTVASPNSLGTLNEDTPLGSPRTFDATPRRLALSAVLEADADHDGFGDTTQDKCPTDPTTQGTCPVKPPPPTESKACKAAKSKLKKARAKLAKLKKGDAPAKKVKKAKKAVKKAKARVKKAC